MLRTQVFSPGTMGIIKSRAVRIQGEKYMKHLDYCGYLVSTG